MRIALLQFAASLDPAANRTAIGALMAEIEPDSCDLVVLPEAAMCDFGPADFDVAAVSESLDGPFVRFLAEEARRLDATIVAGMFESTADRPYNTLVVLGPDGAVRETYRKIHLYDSFGHHESDRFRAGPITPTLIDIGDRRIGLLTCYDLRFPELARQLAADGADMLLVPAAWVAGPNKLEHWVTLLRARAMENVCHVVAAGQSEPRYAAHSLVVDPMGTIVVEASSGPTITVTTVDASEVTTAREDNPSLANRRIPLS